VDRQSIAHLEKADRLGLDDEVVEVSVFFQARQVEMLAEAASRRGMSVGQLIRQFMREYLLRHNAGRE
jgi:hypothetical protein